MTGKLLASRETSSVYYYLPILAYHLSSFLSHFSPYFDDLITGLPPSLSFCSIPTYVHAFNQAILLVRHNAIILQYPHLALRLYAGYYPPPAQITHTPLGSQPPVPCRGALCHGGKFQEPERTVLLKLLQVHAELPHVPEVIRSEFGEGKINTLFSTFGGTVVEKTG